MSRFLPLLFLLFLPLIGQAQDVRYISDKIFVPLHKGPGADYRWAARLTPGLKLTVSKKSADGKWAEVTTSRGTTGWVQAEHLSADTPAQLKLPAAQKRAEQLATKNSELSKELATLKAEKLEMLNLANDTDSQLGSISEELNKLKKISGNAVQLDTDNRRLVMETETLRSQTETLKAENQRLQDNLQSEDFLNGALAVLMGVFVALVVPRLWPRRNKSSSWA